MNAHAAVKTAVPATAPVAALIEAHKAALAESARLWDIHSKLEDATRIPRARVHYSNEIKWSRNGQEEIPVYAYSVAELEYEVRRMELGAISIFPPKQQEQIRARCEERLSHLKAMLLKDIDRENAAKKKAGLPKALAAANRASKAVNKALDAILRHGFITAAEVQLAAAHLIDCFDHEEGVDVDAIMAFVEHLAGRAA